MNPRGTTFGDAIREALEARLREVHVALPGRIVAYDPEHQRADVQPEVQRALQGAEGTVYEPLPVLPDLPVAFPRVGRWALTFPVAVGDHCEIRVGSWAIDQWRATGRDSRPAWRRHHDLSDAWVVPGLHADGEALSVHADNLTLGHADGSQIHIRPDGEIHLGSDGAADYVALAQLVLTELQKIEAWTKTHTHVDPLSGTTGVPATAAAYPAPASVAAGKVKAD